MSVKEKFLDYVSYDTQSDSSSTTMPSTMKQKLLAQHLADEMVAMGIEDAHMDEWGYVSVSYTHLTLPTTPYV